jgi:branched-chain amino acid transport system ATP-binding protein
MLRAITGLLRGHGGRVVSGTVELAGTRIDDRPAAAIVRLGVGQVMEGRRVFAELSVEDNLKAGGFTLRRRAVMADAMVRTLELFPALAGRMKEPAGLLSGGQQQLLAVARALMPSPRLLLLDEPSLGLAPIVLEETAAVLRRVHQLGTTVLIVEQQAGMALGLASQVCVLERGEIVRRGTSDELRDDPSLTDAYLGGGA